MRTRASGQGRKDEHNSINRKAFLGNMVAHLFFWNISRAIWKNNSEGEGEEMKCFQFSNAKVQLACVHGEILKNALGEIGVILVILGLVFLFLTMIREEK